MTHGKNGKTNSMEREFTEYTEALELEELGFDEPCLKYVWNDKKHSQWMHNSSGSRTYHHQKEFTENSKIFTISVPTYQQAFRWFREKYGLFVAPNVISYEGDPYLWFFEINSIMLAFGTDLGQTDDYKTYEEAELACLVKLIEIIKK